MGKQKTGRQKTRAATHSPRTRKIRRCVCATRECASATRVAALHQGPFTVPLFVQDARARPPTTARQVLCAAWWTRCGQTLPALQAARDAGRLSTYISVVHFPGSIRTRVRREQNARPRLPLLLPFATLHALDRDMWGAATERGPDAADDNAGLFVVPRPLATAAAAAMPAAPQPPQSKKAQPYLSAARPSWRAR